MYKKESIQKWMTAGVRIQDIHRTIGQIVNKPKRIVIDMSMALRHGGHGGRLHMMG